MDCKKGGFIHAHQDNLRNLEVALLSEVCKDVSVEPHLQPVTGEESDLWSANTEDEVCLDVKARGFYRQGQCAFFDIRIAYLNAVSNKSQATEKILLRHENEKKRAYNRKVIEIQQGVFTPSVFGTNGAMGKECAIFHKILAKKLAVKYDKPYSMIMPYLRTKISFCLLRSSLLCLRGTRCPFYLNEINF